MKPKNALDKIENLLSAANFTTKEAKQCGVTAETLAYYVKAGEIERLGRGLYRGIHTTFSHKRMLHLELERAVVKIVQWYREEDSNLFVIY